MTKEEIKELPMIIDMLLSKSVLVDTKEKIHEKLAEVCSLAIKVLDQEPCEDCLSRQFILNLGATCIATRNENGKLVALGAIEELPSVTPTRPKGHWIKIGDRGFGWSDTVICKCSECEYQTEFVGKFDGHNLVIDAERADNYCSNCGSDNREVVEE